jgi:hypothetical protein
MSLAMGWMAVGAIAPWIVFALPGVERSTRRAPDPREDVR